MPAPDKTATLKDAAALIKDGDVLAIGGHASCGHPMAMVAEIVRQGRRKLHLAGLSNGMDFDLLIGAGCASAVETSYVGIGDLGPAHAYRRAESGALKVIEHSETTAMARFRATAMGLPFLPTRTGLGTDLPETDPHLTPIEDPYTGEAWLAVQRIVPDVAVIHAHKADRLGNVQLDRDGWHDNSADVYIARSARTVIVTVEQIVSEAAIKARPIDTILPCTDVTCVVEAPYGAHPCCCDGRYDFDLAALAAYHEASATPEGLSFWIEDWVTGLGSHDAYLQKLGSKRLMEISTKRTERM
ncbi:CoA-transferase [Chelativorans sp. AA-79]|uniref:CoA transferase subunit A n=1 Tax=Chelativorans sp. AA-79 TaxID=3028735 RepID=UPI0023F6EE6F|nr:CoA-transferase [Chelativorans sp. AA-79]WEX07264.1 CoA-transferase [Chelativorans sp. AA-79]